MTRLGHTHARRRLAGPALRQAAQERHPLLGALLGVAVLHVLGIGLVALFVAGRDLQLGNGEVFGIGLAVTAYSLGLRHAFDADHIATIDNTTRKFLQEGRRPHASGFFFSAGHSTVVLLLAVLVAAGVHGVGGVVGDENSTVLRIASVWGPTVAGVFLVTIGLLNLATLRASLRAARAVRAGTASRDDLDQQLVGTGILGRTVRRLASRISAPWQLYPLGFLFGLGFDTATEIALLLLAGGGAVSGVPPLAILALPILFAAGMTLLDTLNGAAMTKAYGWSFHAPARRLAYNVAVTGTSVVFALAIGGLSLLGVIVEQFAITDGPLAALASIDVSQLGFALLGIVLVAWAAAAAWWRAQEARGAAAS
jgi:high-affinity nickel-transport protein